MNRKSGVIMSYMAMIFEILSTLFLTPFIIRTLGQAEYGVYKLVAALVAYLMMLDLGVGNSVVRYLSKFRTEKNELMCRKFMGIAIIYYFVIAIVTIIIGGILIGIFPSTFSRGLSPEEIVLGQKLMIITILNAAVTLGTAGFANAITAYEKFIFQKLVLIIQILIRIVLTFLCLKLGMGSVGVVWVQFITTIFCRGVYVIYILFVLKLKPMFKDIEVDMVKEVVLYSSFILLQMIATQINAFADQILLGIIVPSASVLIAVYGVGAQIVTYFQSVGTPITGVLMPGVVKLVENGGSSKELCDEMVKVGRITFMLLGMIWCCFVVNGKQFIVLWVGADNEQAYLVATILMFAQMFILTETIGTQILWALNKHKEQSILKICIVLMNIFLTVMLIKWNALIGATIGTFISLFVGDVIVMSIVFKKQIGISLLYYYKNLFNNIVPCLIITTVTSFLFVSVSKLQGWLGFIINVSFFCAIYAICMYLFGLNSYEKNLIKSISNKLHRKDI